MSGVHSWYKTVLVVAFLPLFIFLAGCGEAPTSSSSNRPPQLTKVSPSPSVPYEVGYAKYVSFYVAASDPDGDTLSYVWQYPNSNAQPNTTYTMPPFLWPSPDSFHAGLSVRVTVSDGRGGTVTQTWPISMSNPTRPITGTWRSAWAVPEVTVELSQSLGTQDGKEFYAGRVLCAALPGGAMTISQLPPAGSTDNALYTVNSLGMTTFYVHAGTALSLDRVWLEGSTYQTTNQLISGTLDIYQDGSRLYAAQTTLDRML